MKESRKEALEVAREHSELHLCLFDRMNRRFWKAFFKIALLGLC